MGGLLGLGLAMVFVWDGALRDAFGEYLFFGGFLLGLAGGGLLGFSGGLGAGCDSMAFRHFLNVY